MADPAPATATVPAPAPVVPAPAAGAPAAVVPAAPAPVADPKAGTMLGAADVKLPAAPVKADYSKLKMPDGSMLPATDVESVKAFAEKHNLSPEVAQAALEERSGVVKSYHEGLVKGHQQSVGEWRKAVVAHPKLGGANLKATDEAVTGVLSRFGPKGLMEEIQAAGYNWKPGFLEFLMNVHEATKSDTFVPSGGAPATQPARTLESMYEPKKK